MNKPFAPQKLTALRIIKIGNSAGVILPKEALARLGVGIGDTVTVTETPDGFRLTGPDDGFDAQMSVAREVMARRRKALRELAK
ncbi:AbrB/MazE/SpoVT family DNA-binding domain-containing protein [Sphingomonas donggukensis]|uniref:AbrB/MazE/SpoVT family DNA-binding domain-containing protein n=1 Tax=Sphingomonas donggukensis TaxID=2949093 RepID=A0ABY4TRU5_9SPHN|nr:AbrB/MazE/SpoVT family DNA-binding domain-containing protein [Sphingomonas donggukensis]URW75120.1 AbrB/MazE/SpoVT family DNA-binding domain-containing protein [Sphingomonas donggukensis]